MNKLKSTLIVLLGLISVVLFYVLITVEGTSLKQTHDWNKQEFTIVVQLYDNEQELNEDKIEFLKSREQYIEDEYQSVYGWAGWGEDENGKFCFIFATEPNRLNDKNTFETLGHELYHCVRGEFHD